MRTILVTVLLVLALLTGAVAADRTWSPDFLALMSEVERQYLEENGQDHWTLAHEFPSLLAMLVGKKMQEQDRYLTKDPSLADREKAVVLDIRAWFGMIAESLDHVEPFTGYRITEDSLSQIVFDAYQGKYDDYLFQEYGSRDLPYGPSIYSMRNKTPEKPEVPESHGKLLHEEDDGVITLLGVPTTTTPDSAEANFNAGVDAWNASLKLWHAGSTAASEDKVEEANYYFDQAYKLGIVGGSGYGMSYVEPDPERGIVGGPQLSSFHGSFSEAEKKSYMTHWNEKECCKGCTPCLN